MNTINDGWKPFFRQEQDQPYFKALVSRLNKAYETSTVYPLRGNVFKAFELDPSRIKVVLIGQDPYHQPGQAQGYSFSVPAGTKIPPSLVNIYKELEQEFQTPIHRSGDLTDWAAQGVFLLNQSLSVERGKPMSHSKIGWEEFSDHLIQYLNTLPQPMVFLLFGRQAQKVKKWLNNPNHLVLEAAHPSPLSAHHGFFGCGLFKKANEFLQAHNEAPIDWTRENL